jgi:uncharacterized protein (DUF4415 family)
MSLQLFRTAARGMASVPSAAFSSAAAAAAKPAAAAAAKPAPKGFQRVGAAQGRNAAPASFTPASETNASRPMLSAVMRSLFVKVHPDLFTAYPEQLATNELSLSTLQGVLSSLKDNTGHSWPSILNEKLRFYFRTKTPGHFRLVQLSLHMPGGKNKALAYQQLSTFFAEVGLSPEFTWDKEYFPMRSAPVETRSKQAEAERAAEQVRQQEAAGQRPDETYEQFSARIKAEVGGKSDADAEIDKDETEGMFSNFYAKYGRRGDKKKK